MTLREQIHKLLREEPSLSGQQISARRGNSKPDKRFWQALIDAQSDMRGGLPLKRRKGGRSYYIRTR